MTVRRSVPKGDEVTCAIREELRELDCELVGVLAARHRLVERLWNHKRAVGRPLEDKKQEGRVLAAARRTARRHGLEATYVEGILRSVIAEGKRRASAEPTARPRSRRPNARSRVRPRG
ncbi:MAG TPA: chorismate mutase [Thermoplasmata archaeon]|nr:chorismate mutase [Thermoplasmata archaeon]